MVSQSDYDSVLLELKTAKTDITELNSQIFEKQKSIDSLNDEKEQIRNRLSTQMEALRKAATQPAHNETIRQADFILSESVEGLYKEARTIRKKAIQDLKRQVEKEIKARRKTLRSLRRINENNQVSFGSKQASTRRSGLSLRFVFNGGNLAPALRIQHVGKESVLMRKLVVIADSTQYTLKLDPDKLIVETRNKLVYEHLYVDLTPAIEKMLQSISTANVVKARLTGLGSVGVFQVEKQDRAAISEMLSKIPSLSSSVSSQELSVELTKQQKVRSKKKRKRKTQMYDEDISINQLPP